MWCVWELPPSAYKSVKSVNTLSRTSDHKQACVSAAPSGGSEHHDRRPEEVIPDACADKLSTCQSVSRCYLEFLGH